MNRVTFYAYGSKYMGWRFISNLTINEIINWIRSGNTVKYKKETVSNVDRMREIYYNL